MATITDRHRRDVRRDPRHRQLPPVADRPERRHRRRDRLQRRVDPAALRHQAAPLRHPRGDRADDVGRGRPEGARARRHRARADRLRDRRDGHPPAADPRHRDRDRLRARHRPGRGLRHLGRLRRLLPRPRPRRPDGPRRRRRPRAGDRRRAALRPHRLDRPRYGVHLRRRRGCRGRRAERHPGHRPGGLGLRRRAVRPDPAERGLARRHRPRTSRRCPA